MTNNTDLHDALRTAVTGDSPADVTAVKALVFNQDRFLFALLRDLLEAAEANPAASGSDTYIARPQQRHVLNPKVAARSLEARLSSMKHWQRDGNETIAAIMSGELDARLIRPHVRGAPADYEDFYANQNASLEKRLAQASDTPNNKTSSKKSYQQVALSYNYNHAFRVPQVVMLVELLFGILDRMSPTGNLSWLDIACGRGEIANGVDPRKFSSREWDITGADLQTAKIEFAKQAGTEGRFFLAADALELLQQKIDDGGRHHIVSMFEFLEHLDDPLKLLRQVAQKNPVFVIAGSPLEQKLNAPREHIADPVHLWSYSRAGWEQMFNLAGLTPVYSGETRLGSYVGGLDWLTMICGPLDWLREHRVDLGATDTGKLD